MNSESFGPPVIGSSARCYKSTVIDYFFAYTQAALSLQQNVTLPSGQVPLIQQSSLVGEDDRREGPPSGGLLFSVLIKI